MAYALQPIKQKNIKTSNIIVKFPNYLFITSIPEKRHSGHPLMVTSPPGALPNPMVRSGVYMHSSHLFEV